MSIQSILASFVPWWSRPLRAADIHSTPDVFVAGPTPTITFVDRSSSPEFKGVSRALQQRGKIISLTGPSKTGKTVISVNQVLKNRSPVLVSAARIDSVEAFWDALRGELKLPRKKTLGFGVHSGTDKAGGIGASLGAEGQGEIALGGEIRRSEGFEVTTEDEYDADSIAEVEAKLRKQGTPIVIDDFHWITDGALQVKLIKSLRPLLQTGTSVILTSVTELNSRAWQAIPDLKLLHMDVKIPHWTFDQLVEIARLGFNALNVEIDDRVFRIMARYSYRNPMLMQEYCGRLAYELDIDETLPKRRRFEVGDDKLEVTLTSVAKEKGRLYAKYSETRGEASWKLANGKLVNVNQLAFLALSRVWVMVPIRVDALARRMRQLLAADADRVRLINATVTQALERISTAMFTELETRTPLALDPGTSQLNILDPIFKAYLSWELSPKYLNEHPPLTPVEPPDESERST